MSSYIDNNDVSTNELSIIDQYKKIKEQYNLFIDFFNANESNYNKKEIKTKQDKKTYKSLVYLKQKFKLIVDILQYCVENDITLNTFFKIKRKQFKISKRNFYLTKYRLCSICDQVNKDYYAFCYKEKTKKHIDYVYSQQERKQIQDYFYNLKTTNPSVSSKSIYQDIKEKNVLNSSNENIKKLSYKTFDNILKEDERWLNIKHNKKRK